MPGNTFGQAFCVTTFGESHGPAIGCVIDGTPPGISLSEDDIQPYVNRRRTGQTIHTSQRQEPDTVKILSGVFEGRTTGTPIGLLIENQDQRSRDYGEIKDAFRPGHADFTYQNKYGTRDYRGGGRASARETAMRVAAGAVARKVLGASVNVRGALVQMGPRAIDRTRWDWEQVTQNPFWCPDQQTAELWDADLTTVRKAGSSIGAIIEVTASGVPIGLGEPVFDKLDADIAKAMMSIPAVKGVEIGAGFAAATLSGPENADEMRMRNGRETFLSNNAGGILGGISNGDEIVVRFAVKPTSSILTPRQTVNIHGEDVDVRTKGRHDPCVGIRAVPVGEAMLALVLADHWIRHQGQCGRV